MNASNLWADMTNGMAHMWAWIITYWWAALIAVAATAIGIAWLERKS